MRLPGAVPLAAATPAPPLRTLRARRSIRPSLSSSCGAASSRPSRVLTTFHPDRSAVFPVTPGLVPAGVYPLGQAGRYLGGRVEVEDRAPDARAEVGKDALRDRVLVHLEDGPTVHLAERVPRVAREMVVVVDPDLTAREELLVRQRKGRAPLPRRPPGALLAQETPQAPEELVRRERGSICRVLGVDLAAQEPREVVEEPPVGREIQVHTDPSRAVHALYAVRRMAGRKRHGPAEMAFGSQRETDSHAHVPQILTHATRRRRNHGGILVHL